MSFIPALGEELIEDNDISSVDISSVDDTWPSKTWIIRDNRVIGVSVGVDAFVQSMDTALSTERYEYDIFSDNYGIELEQLVGMPTSYAVAMLPDIITDALMQDDRVESVTNFSFDVSGSAISAKFTVTTKDREQIEREELINV